MKMTRPSHLYYGPAQIIELFMLLHPKVKTRPRTCRPPSSECVEESLNEDLPESI